ncbi:MAG: hypothetical protein QXX12_03050 [Nanopusillaceae archaeon]
MSVESSEIKKEKKWCTIIVKKHIKEALEILRRELHARSLNEVISALILAYERMRVQRIKLIMCNDFRETSASHTAWIRLLRSRGLSDIEILDAFKYLVGSFEDMRVDTSKCVE